ncbi:MAG: type II toxin-antitoxin system VapC family toxin, partial [Proteobacteria bacterium]|nr:type II toxin-antitoxin system VapC family toxin [Pseudomonadota bacterium]
MILYLDTSALLKKYFKENGSSDIISLWKKTTAVVTSTVAYAETMASIFRKKREAKDIDESLFESVIISFQKDWMSFIHVDVSNDLNEEIGKLVTAHPLRGFDAIHLASALTVHEHI